MRIIKRGYRFLRYDISHGIGNLVRFFPVVWRFREWDYSFNLNLMLRSLKYTRSCIFTGMEVDETRMQRVEAIDSVIALIDRHNNECLKWDIECREWKELWQIVSGDEDIPGSDMRGWWD